MNLINSKYSIPVGTKVSFDVENSSQLIGDFVGELCYENNAYFIKPVSGGKLGINEWLCVPINTIKPYHNEKEFLL